MNFWTHPAVVAIDPASRAEIGRRSTFVMFTTQQPQFLERLELLARAVSSDVPRLAIDVHFTTIPPGLENDPRSEQALRRRMDAEIRRVRFRARAKRNAVGYRRLTLFAAPGAL